MKLAAQFSLDRERHLNQSRNWLNPISRFQGLVLLISCIFFPVTASAGLKSVMDLSQETLPKYASSITFAKRKTYSSAQLFILQRKLTEQNNLSRSQAVLNRLDQKADWSVKPIVAVEQIKVYLKKPDRAALLVYLVKLADHPDAAQYEKTIFTTLTEHFADYPDTNSVREALAHLLPKFDKWRRDPDLITWMLTFFKAGDTYRLSLIGSLWAGVDINEFPAALIPELALIQKNPDRYQQFVSSHFSTQYHLKNWSYIISKAPAYLSEMGPENDGFIKTRRIYLKTFFRKRQYSKLIDLLSQSGHSQQLALKQAEKATLLFRLWLKKGYIKEARIQLALLEKSNDTSELGAMYFELADFFFSRNRFKESLVYLNQISPANASEKLIPLAQWRKLWAHYRLNQKREMATITAWSESYPFESREVAAKFCYWSVKLKLNPRRRALSCYQEFPLTYYGFRSLHMSGSYTGIEKTILPKRQDTSQVTLSGKQSEFLAFIHVLYISSYTEFADALVMRYMKQEQDPLFFSELAAVLFRSKRFYLQQLLVDLYFGETLKKSQSVNEPLLSVYYPAGYIEEVSRHIGTSTLPRALAFAVMREESNFRPEVESPAGAVGLMQLMPTTARYVAKIIRTRYQQTLLVHPDFNVKLGVAYLKRLLRRYKGNLFYTLAAYNGGATNVKRWRKKAHSKDFDVFVETITFIETQNYVKRVVRSYFIYQLLYGEKTVAGAADLLSLVLDRVPVTGSRQGKTGG